MMSSLSDTYCMMPGPICLRLLAQLVRRAFSRARAKVGNSMAARIAIMAMTTKVARLDKQAIRISDTTRGFRFCRRAKSHLAQPNARRSINRFKLNGRA